MWRSVEALAENKALSLISRRGLCEFLRCAEDPASLARACHSATPTPVG